VAITEEGRHRMYGKLEAVLGHDDATMLMEHLPPVGWADVATKQDLALLRSEIRADMAQLESRLLRSMLTAIVVSNATLVGLVSAVVKLG
jgi:hypothetical protein